MPTTTTLILDTIRYIPQRIADRADRTICQHHRPLIDNTCPRCHTPWPCPPTLAAMDRMLARPVLFATDDNDDA